MDPLTAVLSAAGLVLTGIASAVGCLLLGRSLEARAGAAELQLERDRRQLAEGLAAERALQLEAGQRLLADAARGDASLAALGAQLAAVPGGDPRERARRLLQLHAGGDPGPAAGPGAPGPASAAGDDGAAG